MGIGEGVEGSSDVKGLMVMGNHTPLKEVQRRGGIRGRVGPEW